MEEQDAQARKQKLTALKMQILQKQQMERTRVTSEGDDDDDDELQVLAPTKIDEQRKSAEKKMSKGQRMLLTNAGIRNKPVVLDPHKSAKRGIVSTEETILKQGTSDPRVLITFLRQRVDKESLDIVKQKEEEWKRLGGAIKEDQGNEPVDDAQLIQIQKGLEAWTKADRTSMVADAEDGGDEGEEDDPDWSPEARGSMSPASRRDEEAIDYEKLEMGEVDDVGTPKADKKGEREETEANQSDDENEQVPVFKVKSKHRPLGRILDSDESDSGEYNDGNASLLKPNDPHYAASSSDDRTEDENDKENDTRLMFDRSEDKENKAVVRHQPLAGPSLSFRSVFDGESDSDLSLSPPHVMVRELDMDEGNGTQPSSSPNEKRKPFGVISDASPASLQRQPSTLTQAFAEQLKHSSPARGPISEDVFGPISPAPAASLDFAPVFGASGDVGKEKKSALGFSQFSQEESERTAFGTPSLLQPGFADLFDSSTQKDVSC